MENENENENEKLLNSFRILVEAVHFKDQNWIFINVNIT